MLCQVWQIEALCVFALLHHDFTHTYLIFRLHNELPQALACHFITLTNLLIFRLHNAPNINSLHYFNQLANVIKALHITLQRFSNCIIWLFVCYAEHVIELNKHLGVNLRDTRRMQSMWGRAQ